jgi:hypothetical protein
MQSLNSLLKEELDLDTEILGNRIQQLRYFKSMVLNPNLEIQDRMDITDKMRDLEDRIDAQLSNRAKAKNQRDLFNPSVERQNAQLKREFIRLKVRREGSEKYKSMKLKDLLKK